MTEYTSLLDEKASLCISGLSTKYSPNAGIGKDACPWLDDYIDFSQKWSPRAHSLYHTACGLWVLSTVAARRVTTSFGKKRFTNFTVLLVGRTGLWAKSMTAQIAKETILKGGFGHLLLPDMCTPEKMVSMMASRLPEGYENLTVDEKDNFKQLLPFIGQRGWYYDEVSMLFRAMGRRDSPMASFHGLLRKLDDTEETYQNATISRGNDIIQKPYLAFLGCITPADMLDIAYPGAPMWSDGFFGRYLFAVPPKIDPPDGRFPVGEREIPSSLLFPLQEWNKRLGIPKVEIHHGLVDIEHKPVSLTIDPDVFDGYYLYLDGLREMIKHNEVCDLDGNYIRLPEFALRFSMLFSSLSGSSVISIAHWNKAVGIVEDFRMSLHFLYQQMSKLTRRHREISSEEKILNVINKKESPTQREIQQQTGLSTEEVQIGVSNLLAEGPIEEFPDGKTFRYRKKVSNDI